MSVLDAPPAVRRLPGRSLRRWRRSRATGQRPPVLPLVILGLLLVAAVFGDALTGLDAGKGGLRDALKPPVWGDGGTWRHALGTDPLGRDVLARLLEGARTTLVVAVAGVGIAGVVGSTIGLLAGYFGGWVESVLMRFTDIVLAIPVLILGLAMATLLGRGVFNIVLVLTAVTWTFYARMVRSEVLRLRESDFVHAARLSGVSSLRILRRHLLPNVLNVIVVVGTLQVGYTIIVAASLSFLGLGVPNSTPEWGLMLAEGQPYLKTAWWLSVFPGIALAATVLSANVLGDWIRDVVDPSFVGGHRDRTTG